MFSHARAFFTYYLAIIFFFLCSPFGFCAHCSHAWFDDRNLRDNALRELPANLFDALVNLEKLYVSPHVSFMPSHSSSVGSIPGGPAALCDATNFMPDYFLTFSISPLFSPSLPLLSPLLFLPLAADATESSSLFDRGQVPVHQ